MKFSKRLWGLLLVLATQVSVAAPSAPDPNNSVLAQWLPESDYSLAYLKELFGDVGGMIHSNASGFFGDFIVGDLFGVLNTWMLTFAVLVLMYIVFVGTLSTANDGKAMGEKGHSLWIPVRGAISIAMLAPAHISGYCLAQKLVMFIVLAGVAGANAMWSHVVDKLVSKDLIAGVISQHPTFNNGKLMEPIQAIFEQQACRNALYKKHGNGKLKVQGPFYDNQGRVPNVEYDTASYAVFSTNKDGNTHNKAYLAGGALTYGVHKMATSGRSDPGNRLKPICGGIWWTIPFFKTPTDTVTQTDSNNTVSGKKHNIQLQQNTNLEYKVEEVVGMLYNQLNYAGKYFGDEIASDGSEYVCYTGLSDSKIQEILPDRVNVGEKYGCFVQAMQDYSQLVSQTMQMAKKNQAKFANYAKDPYVNVKSSSDDGDNQSEDGETQVKQHSLTEKFGQNFQDPVQLLRKHIKEQGWANAGSYFYNIVELSNAGLLSPVQLNILPMYATGKKDIKTLEDVQQGINDYMQHSYQKLNQYYNRELDNPDEDVISQNKSKRAGLIIRSNINYDFGDAQLSGTSRLILDVMTLGIGEVVANWDHTLLTSIFIQRNASAKEIGLTNPIIALQALGKTELDEVSEIWINGMEVIGSLTMASSMLDLVGYGSGVGSTVATGVSSTISWLQTIMSPIAILLFSSGFMLAIWLPFAPYILSIFCVFGWLLSVIEMMVAAPIIALGVLSPEGHDIFGKASPAVMLSLGIFLRPMLMVFGFIVGLIAIYVASNLVNAGFLHMVHSVFRNHLTLLSAVGVLTMYTLVMTSLANKSFGLMTQISERVLRWIGGRDATFDQGELQSLNDVKGGVQEAGKAAGEGASKTTSPDTKAFDAVSGLLPGQDSKDKNDSGLVRGLYNKITGSGDN